MKWFKSKATNNPRELEQKVTLQVRSHEKKTEPVVKSAEKATANLGRLIKDNGFTLQIHSVIRGGR